MAKYYTLNHRGNKLEVIRTKKEVETTTEFISLLALHHIYTELPILHIRKHHKYEAVDIEFSFHNNNLLTLSVNGPNIRHSKKEKMVIKKYKTVECVYEDNQRHYLTVEMKEEDSLEELKIVLLSVWIEDIMGYTKNKRLHENSFSYKVSGEYKYIRSFEDFLALGLFRTISAGVYNKLDKTKFNSKTDLSKYI